MTDQARNEDFRRKPQLFADSLLVLQKTSMFGMQETAANCRFSQKNCTSPKTIPCATLDWFPFVSQISMSCLPILVGFNSGEGLFCLIYVPWSRQCTHKTIKSPTRSLRRHKVVRKNNSHPLARGLGWSSCALPLVHQWIFLSRRHPTAPNGLWCTTPSNSPQLGFGMQQLKDSGSVGD